MNLTNSTRTISDNDKVIWYWSVRAVIAILTVLGNTFVMILIARSHRLRVIQNAFIFALALTDTLVGAVITPADFACTFWHPHSCDIPKLRFTFDILINLSVTSLCALTFDRFMAVVKPLKYHTFMTKSRVPQILSLSWIFGVTLPIVGYTCFLENNRLAVDIVRILNTIFLQILPPVLLAIAYIVMVFIAKKHDKLERIQQSQLQYNYGNVTLRESRERASVKMIGAVIVAFILCYTLAIFRSLYFYVMDRQIPVIVTQMSRILLLTSSSVNFVVYAFLKKDFRQELRRIFKKFKQKLQEVI